MQYFSLKAWAEKRLCLLKSAEALGDDEYLDELGGFTRSKESTIDAGLNTFGGLGQAVFRFDKTRGRFSGVLQAGQGVLDAADALVSIPADIATAPLKTRPPAGKSKYKYNVTRAFGSLADSKDPLDAAGGVIDVIHSGFKIGSDITKAVRLNSAKSLGAQEVSAKSSAANTVSLKPAKAQNAKANTNYELAA